jgi:hypothetical protein
MFCSWKRESASEKPVPVAFDAGEKSVEIRLERLRESRNFGSDVTKMRACSIRGGKKRYATPKRVPNTRRYTEPTANTRRKRRFLNQAIPGSIAEDKTTAVSTIRTTSLRKNNSHVRRPIVMAVNIVPGVIVMEKERFSIVSS